MICIRTAAPGDAQRISEIYRPYVEHTAVTFEYEAPDAEEIRRRMTSTLRRYPYLVALEEGVIVGYAYAGAFKERAAYDHSAEMSIYLDESARGRGIGRMLYSALEQILAKQNIFNLNACIAYTQEDDEYLTSGSVRFHEHMGYVLVGEFHKCGYKFGHWYNMVWMEKMTGAHPDSPEEMTAFPDLDPAYVPGGSC